VRIFEDAVFDDLVKRFLSEEWERFPAPSARVWRALTLRLGAQVKRGSDGAGQPREIAQGSHCIDGHDGDGGVNPIQREG
jgi:hypothetical protein